jgi:hypothetical protein
MRDAPRRPLEPAFSNSARRLAKRASAKRRKINPRTGVEYCAAVRPELARSWSAASQSRFSRVFVAVSFSDGAIHCMAKGSNTSLMFAVTLSIQSLARIFRSLLE